MRCWNPILSSLCMAMLVACGAAGCDQFDPAPPRAAIVGTLRALASPFSGEALVYVRRTP